VSRCFFVRSFAAVVAVLFVFVGTAHAAAPPRRANLPQLARSLVKAGAPGAIVYVRTPTATRSGAAGFANLSTHTTMRAADRYRIASVSKAFVAVVVLQLEAEGRLDIDDPVERWLPGVVPNGAAITLRELLNHTSGLFNYTDDPTFFETVVSNAARVWAPLELLAFAFAHAPTFRPGTNWSYSNTNYVVLGLVVEAVTGKPLGQSLQERIFAPLSLTSTSFPAGIELDATFVHGYVTLGQSPLIDVTPALNPSWAWAAGGIVSNARDVTIFYRALLTGRLLPSVQLAEMKIPSPVAGTYGLGISSTFTSCGSAVGHDGDFPGWRNEAIATANGKREAVVMINVDETYVRWQRLQAVARTALCRG
jgi:D-alanyl-D-alanine carboxypeptidase